MIRLGMVSEIVLALLIIPGSAVCLKAMAQQKTAEEEMNALATSQRAVLTRINLPDEDGRLRSFDTKGMGALLEEGWSLGEKWSARWLEDHPAATKKELDTIFDGFSPPPRKNAVYDPSIPESYFLTGSVTRIAPDVYVLRETYVESQGASGISTFSVIGRRKQERFAKLWSIRPLAKRHFASKDELGLWAFRGSCAYYCGSLVIDSIAPLPATKDGRPRFAVEAMQATNGSTGLLQYSIWRWDGLAASSLFVHSYADYLDDARGVRMTGGTIVLPTKEPTKSFGVYGCCGEPLGVWRIRLTKRGATDLGHHLLQPEVGWVDRLLVASGKHAPAGATLASTSVLRKLRRSNLEVDSLGSCEVRMMGRGGNITIELSSGARLWLAYELRRGQPYFTAVKTFDD